MNKIEIYLSIVEKNLFINNKEEVISELKDQIYSEVDDEYSNVDEILNRLGNPEKLALQYVDNSEYLIGPKYYNSFKYSLFKTYKYGYSIFIICYLTVLVIQYMFNNEYFLEFLSQFIWLSINFFMISTLVVLGIFFIYERTNYKSDNKQEWTTNDLPKEEIERNNRKLKDFVAEQVIIIINVIIVISINNISITIENSNYTIFNNDVMYLFTILMLTTILYNFYDYFVPTKKIVILISKLILLLLLFVFNYYVFISMNFIEILSYVDSITSIDINNIIFAVISMIYAVSAGIQVYHYIKYRL